MGLFWLLAALMLVVALAFILPPMLSRRRGVVPSRERVNLAIYRERLAELEADHQNGRLGEGEYEQARGELERAMLDDLAVAQAEASVRQSKVVGPPDSAKPSPLLAVIIAGTVSTVSFIAYHFLGTPEAVTDAPVAQGGASQGSTAEEVPSIEELVVRLETRLRDHPEDGEGWFMLGRTYAALGRLTEARDALAEAAQRLQDNPDLLAAYAEVLAKLNDNQLVGEPARLIRRALQIAPNSPRVLWMAGFAALQGGNNTEAVGHWERLRGLGNLNGEEAHLLDDLIAQAKGEASALPPGSVPQPKPQLESRSAGDAPSPADVRLEVQVSLIPALAERVSPTDPVFIFARAAEGPRMPLAIVKTQVRDLPTTVTFDDSMAMMPSMKLSQFPEVIVGARVSKTGNAIPASGDLQGLSGRIKPMELRQIHVVIRDVVP